MEEVKQFQDCEDDGKDVAQALHERTCRAVPDGTYKDNEGAAAFVVQGIQHKHQLLGCNRTPGRQEEMSPFRELGGAIGVLTLRNLHHHDVTEGKMILAFDCESAIKTLWAEKDPKVTAPDYDMVMECRRRIKALPIEVEIKWIRGHQDKVAGAVLDWWAQTKCPNGCKSKKPWQEVERTSAGTNSTEHRKVVCHSEWN